MQGPWRGRLRRRRSSTRVAVGRYYDPQTGQFLSVDPLVDETGEPYAYAEDDPVNSSDPTGLWCIFGHNPNGGCRGSATVVNAWHQTDNAWDCLTSACYTTKQGAANAWAGAHNTLNYISGLPPVPAPYPCSNSDAYALGGQLPYFAVGLVVPGSEEAALLEEALADEGSSGGIDLAAGWRGTNMTDQESFAYHYAVHGDGLTPLEYAQDAQAWAASPSGAGTPVQLADGSWGLRYRTPGGGPGGILDSNGSIVTFWTH
jgi:RHS repeat-associated protein